MTVFALTTGYGTLPVQGAEIPVQVTIDPSSDPEEYVVGVEGSALAAALDGQEIDVTITSFKNAGIVAGTIEDGVTNGLAIGEDSYVKNNGGLAIGDGAKAGNERTAQTDTATHATAIGTDSEATSDNSTAIGYSSKASGKNSIAIGDSIASGENNIAIGYQSELTNFHKDNTAVGTATQINADAGTAIGKGAYVSGDYGTAIGRGADSWSDSSVALGSYAKVDNNSGYAVALGAGSVASEADTVSVGVSEKDADDEHAVKTRRIVNVKDGRFEEGSTDAVTAGQLYDAGIVPGKAADGSVAIGNGSTVTSGAWDWDTNTPLPANGVAIGDNAKVNGSVVNGVAIGQGAEVRTDNATAIGQGSRVVSGDGSVALGQGSMVTAADAKGTDAHGVVSVGLTGNKVTEGFTRRIINVADGINDSDAATYGQVKDVDAKLGDLDFSDTHSLKKAENVTDALTKLDTKAYNLSGKIDDFSRSGIMAGGTLDSRNAGTNSIQLGNQARAAGQNSIAFGAGASVTGENTEESIQTRAKNNGVAIGYSATAAGFNTTVLGAAAKAQGDNATALGQGTLVTADNSVALGAGSHVTTDDIRDSDTNGVVSVGKSDGERRIINVADGVNDSDAATVGQISKITGMDSEKGNVVQYNGEDKSTITFAGTNGTALNNVNDIVMNVKNPINKKTEQHSFQNAGLLPGKVEGTATSGKWNMAIGEGSEVAVDGGTGANMKFNTAIGNSAGVSQNIVNGDYVDVERSTAIGHAAKVSASNSTAIGDSSNAGEDNSVAIGQKAEVQSATSIAIGQGTKIGGNAENSIAIGTSANQYSVGSKAKNSTVVGVNAWSLSEGGTVLGKSAKIQGSAANGTAIGTNATINVSAGSGNVALGADSTVSKADVGGDTAHGVVSVGQSGDKGFNRRIINVADGVNDSDAATVKQVKAVQGDVDELNKLAVTYTDNTKKAVNFNGATLKNVGDIQIGNAQSTFAGSGLINGKVYNTEAGTWAENGANATHSMAVGSKSSVRGKDSIAVGPEATVNNGNSVVLEQSTAVGSKATVLSNFSTALGAHTQAKGNYSVAVGAQSQTTGANATAIGAYAAAGENSVVVGGGEGLAAPIVKSNGTAMGTYVDINADNGTALGYGSQVGGNGKNSVALGADSVANEENVVSVGHTKGQANGFGGTYGEDLNRRITNVADGKNANDAATVGQISKITGMDSEKGNVVQYDNESKDRITFGGANGTELLNISNLSAKTATIGNVSFTDDGRITNVTAGVNDSDVATVGQIKNLTGLDSTQGNVVQYDKEGNLNVSVGDSGLKVDNTASSISHGDNSISVGDDGTTVTGDLNVTGDLTFNGETVSSDDLANAANVAGDVSDIKEQIGAGADGKLGLTNEQTTLVGGINANTEAINGVKTIVGDGKLDNGAADLTAGINANSAAIEQNRQAIGALGSRVSDLGEEVDSVGAISAALAGLHPLDYNGTGSKFQISAALGTYDGTQAAAIGGFYHFNRDTLLSIGGSTSFEGDRKTAANVGVTFRVGEGASEAPAVQDNETKQQMEAMKQEIEMLKAELEQLKNKDTEGTNAKN